MRLLIAPLFLVSASCAFAQTPPPSMEAQAQACMSKLLETTQSELNVRAQAITWQHALVAAQAKIKELEAKVKAAPATPPPPAK